MISYIAELYNHNNDKNGLKTISFPWYETYNDIYSLWEAFLWILFFCNQGK